MKKVRKIITINDFIELWQNIEKRTWEKVMPLFWDRVRDIWVNEINERFRQLKKGGSYGPVNEFALKTLLENTENPTLDRGAPYSIRYAKRFPITYKKTGYLEQQIQNASVFEKINEKDEIGVKINIPIRSDPKGGWYTYSHLEQKRSFIMSSFILAWPKIIQTILESIGEK